MLDYAEICRKLQNVRKCAENNKLCGNVRKTVNCAIPHPSHLICASGHTWGTIEGYLTHLGHHWGTVGAQLTQKVTWGILGVQLRQNWPESHLRWKFQAKSKQSSEVIVT